MNIFYVETDPYKAAESMVDKHVVKMILESAQLLSTAHRLLDGVEYVGQSQSGRKAKRWRLPDDREHILYSATHIHHPSAVWCRENRKNYEWLFGHFIGLLNEYTYRYGKTHKCAEPVFVDRLSRFPTNMAYGDFTDPTPAMLDEYKIGDDSLASYRNYYKVGKTHLHKWTKRETPQWML